MIRPEVKKLKELESVYRNIPIDYDVLNDDLIELITLPISYEEGEVIISLVSSHAFRVFEWKLIDLIESLYGEVEDSVYRGLLEQSPDDDFKESLLERMNM